MGVSLDRTYYDYSRFSRVKPLTEFKDIEIGVMYHIPPTILYPRRDFLVESKTCTTVRGKIREGFSKTWEEKTLYQSELSMKFLVKRQKIGSK